ncbi:MAG: hypothetical protein JXA30_07850 [Deltaproteobacteria bacterium]|nr:hypothetical protein [Deltaproteobacteria bacterium]
MTNGRKKTRSLYVSSLACVFICSCNATGNDQTQPIAGSGVAGAVGQNAGSSPISAAGTSGGVTSPEQPSEQPDAQVTEQPGSGGTTAVGTGGGSPVVVLDSGTPDGNTVTAQKPDSSIQVTPVQPVGDGQTCLQPGSGTYAEPGPYKVTRIDGVDLVSILPAGTAAPTTYSIWHPEPLEAGCKHPVVAWGNGTTVTGANVYDFFNRNAASWGIVVIGSDNSNVGSGAYHRAAIDYMLQQNQDPSSAFYQKLSDRAGTAGHSQGGMGATAATTHPSVFAEVSVAGGGMVNAKVAFMCLTGTEDFVNTMCTASYNGAAGPAFLANWQGGDHVTTETLAGYIARDPGTLQMQRLYAAWFRCFLADDPVACGMFKGTPCGICNDPGWATISNRNM